MPAEGPCTERLTCHECRAAGQSDEASVSEEDLSRNTKCLISSCVLCFLEIVEGASLHEKKNWWCSYVKDTSQ